MSALLCEAVIFLVFIVNDLSFAVLYTITKIVDTFANHVYTDAYGRRVYFTCII